MGVDGPRTTRRAHAGAALAAAAGLVLVGACGSEPSTLDGRWSDEELALLTSLSPLTDPPPSPGNLLADDPRAAALGQALFFETDFGPGGVSCATCHVPNHYFTDGRALAHGLADTERHTPTILGSQYGPWQFWDGRADSLWAQAVEPFENPLEVGSSRLEVAHVIAREHREPYEELFGPLPDLADRGRFPVAARPVPGFPEHPHQRAWSAMSRDDRDAVTEVLVNAAKAIEAYERLLLPRPAPFDRYVAALEAGRMDGDGHLSPAAVRGAEAFVGPAGCINCHNGPLLTDHGFHNVGLKPPSLEHLDAAGRAALVAELDPGRSAGAWKALANPFRSDGPWGDADAAPELEFLDPSFEDFVGAFKTPTLRNIAMTAPYGHAGQFESLEEVVEWYRDLPRVPMVGHRDLVLGLFDDEVATGDLVAFLESLTGPLPEERFLGPPR